MKITASWTITLFLIMATTACGDTVVSQDQECEPGAVRCGTDGSVETCSDSGQFVFSKQCSVNEQCSAGDCVTISTDGPCAAGTHTCDPNATCIPMEAGGYTCECNTGFSGSGATCTADGECTSNDECTLPVSNDCTEAVCDNGSCATLVSEAEGCCEDDGACASDDDACTEESCVLSQCQSKPIENCCVSTEDCIPENEDCQKAIDCQENQCVFESLECCKEDIDCNDENPCTTDICDAESQSCQNNAIANCCTNPGDCDDGNLCTADSCADGQCANTAIEGCCTANDGCDDNNSCTANKCVDEQCEFIPVDCCESDSDCDESPTDCIDGTCTKGQCSSGLKQVGSSCGLQGKGTCDKTGACGTTAPEPDKPGSKG